MTAASRRPVCLDVTRLVSRVGAGPHTGIDRVELAYLRGLLDRDADVFGFARTATGFVLLDRTGMTGLKVRIEGSVPWGGPDIFARLSRRISPARRAAEADLRRLARDTAMRGGATRLLGRALAPGALFLNVGHSNLSPEVARAIRRVPGASFVVMIHDTIPLRLPETQRPGASERFRARLAVAATADAILCPSQSERVHVEEALAEAPWRPPVHVAHLGIDRPEALPTRQSPLVREGHPTFVTVGTIEARKNHALLLDVWDHLASQTPPGEMPDLCIVGRRGWNDPDLFRRLDRHAGKTGPVREYGDLTDAERTALVAASRALLFPSRAEGFGLPPLEALALGVPVVCAPLPVYRELMGDLPVYAAEDDMYLWADIVRRMVSQGRAKSSEQETRAGCPDLPTWQDHLDRVLSAVG